MRNVWKAVVLLVGVFALSGCGVAGKWTLDTITPEDARGHYELACVHLDKDGTYAARAQKGGETVTSAGKYTFEDNKLCFTSDKGKTRTYDARLVALGSKLEVKTVVDGKEIVALMKRCQCQKGDECGEGEKCAECPQRGKCAGCEKPAREKNCAECAEGAEHENCGGCDKQGEAQKTGGCGRCK